MHRPRAANAEEIEDLTSFIIFEGSGDHTRESAECLVDGSAIAIFDDYQTDTPGFAGKVMVVVFPASPDLVESFVWREGVLYSTANTL